MIEQFVRLEPHQVGMAAIRPQMLPTAFVFWNTLAEDLPIGWDEVGDRLNEREIRSDVSRSEIPTRRASP